MGNKKGAHRRPRAISAQEHWSNYIANKEAMTTRRHKHRQALPAPIAPVTIRRRTLATDIAKVGPRATLVAAPTVQYVPVAQRAGHMHIASHTPPAGVSAAFCGVCGLSSVTASLTKCSRCGVATCLACGDMCEACSADICFKCLLEHERSCVNITGKTISGAPAVPADPTDPTQAIDYEDVSDDQIDWSQQHNLFI